MNYIKLTPILFASFFTLPAFSQVQEEINLSDSTGLAGDHFSLQGALELFKSSSSLEDFEKKLNADENSVNNLDLNGDGEVDYVRVVDNFKDSAHAIVLQVSVSETELQDVAVIELEKNGKESALVQIVGDEELYGENEIVEPFDEKDVMEGQKGNKGPMAPTYMTARMVINVWHWPCVKYVYAPAYVVWVSPWKWHYYPAGWKPWKVHPWRRHHIHSMHYHHHYHRAPMHRAMVAHTIYAPHRRGSAIVKTRYASAHVNHKTRKANSGGPHSKNIQPIGKQKMSKGSKPGQVAPKKSGAKSGGKQGGGGKGHRK